MFQSHTLPFLRKQSSTIYALTAVLIPVLVQLIWLFHHTQLPQSDATEPLLGSFLVYDHFAHHEWWEFFKSLFAGRLYRPIAFYMTEVPFQIISHGNLLFTARAVTAFFTILNCLYTYYLLRLALGEKVATLGTILLGLMPVFQWPSAFFALTEIAFMPATLASIYYMIRSENFIHLRYSTYFVIATFVAFTMRPVEAFLHLVPAFMFLLGLSYYHKRIGFFHIFTVITTAAVGAGTLVLFWFHRNGAVAITVFPGFKTYTAIAYIILIVTALLILCFTVFLFKFADCRRLLKQYPPYVIPCFATLSALVALYYYSFITQLVTWVYACSIGELAKETDTRRASISIIWNAFLISAGELPFIAISVLGILSFIVCLSKEQRKSLLQHPLLYLACMIPLPLLIVFISVQATQRKITTIFGAYLILLIVPALMRGRLWYVRMALLVLVILVQIYGLSLIYSARPSDPRLYIAVGGFGVPELVTASPNPHDQVANFIISAAKKHGYKRVMLPIIAAARVLDPFLISAMVTMYSDKEIEPIFNAYVIPNYDTSMMPKLIEDMHPDAFITLPDRPITHSPTELLRLQKLKETAWFACDKIAYDLLMLYVQDNMESIGGKKVECAMVGSMASPPDNQVEACMYEFKKKQH